MSHHEQNATATTTTYDHDDPPAIATSTSNEATPTPVPIARLASKAAVHAKRRQPDPTISKPPPIDVTHVPSNSPNLALGGPASKRPPPTYPRWASSRDPPRLARTINDFALFLASLPVPVHKLVPRVAARVIAKLLARNHLMATNIAFDLALLFWRLIINIFFRSIQPRGAWRIPTEGPVIFVGGPHHNQVS